MFSKACECAIKIMIFVGDRDKEELMGAKDISEKISVSEPFTSKILQKLTKRGLLKSIKGRNGGFYLAKSAQEIKILDVVEAIDGDEIMKCILGFEECSGDNPCPLHHKYKHIKGLIQQDVLGSSLKEIKENLAI